MRKLILLSLYLVISIVNVHAQKPMTTSYEARWKSVDNLLQKDLQASAQKEIDAILKQARSEQNSEEYLRALCVLRTTLQDRDESARKNDILFFEHELKQAQFPSKPLLHSMVAELYWTYYEENRWKIMNRTQGSTVANLSDMETWSADNFYQKTYEHYLASLDLKDDSKRYPISKLQKILLPGEHTETLRPTLYDFLIHRAIDFFKNDEIEITKPEYAFEIDDKSAFAPAMEFVNLRFKTSDTESPKYTALELLQDAIRFHLNDPDPSALLDADLERLDYVFEKSISTDKLHHYREALKRMASDHSKHPLAAKALLAYAQSFIQEDHYDQENDTSNYVQAASVCKDLVTAFPNSEAGIEASNVLAGIYRHELHLTTEKVVLPDNKSLAKIEFRNVNKVYCKLATISQEQLLTLQRYSRYGESDQVPFLMNLDAYKQWSVNLPKSEDYKLHSTEIDIDALPIGNYVFMISETNDFSEGHETSFSMMQVSNLAYIIPQENNRGSNSLFVVHRKHGEALADITVKTWLYNYDYNSRKQVMTPAGTYTTDQQGKVTIEAKNQNIIPEIIQGKDHLLLFDNLYYGDTYEQYPEQTRAFLFTDRSIYRPGQTIYFKAIVLRSKGKNYKEHELLQNKKTSVKFYDANYQVIKEETFTTNNYGSIHGSFIAPEGLLTGQFMIQCEQGQVYFNVEEYKRPKFEVVFDTVKESFRLNDEITVSGKAKAFAGNAIDGGVVNYTVTRRARFPYWWCFYRWGARSSAEMAIAHGKAKTDQNGSFEFKFVAKPDATVSKESKPVFDFEVHADITDVNGETRSGASTISVGYERVIVELITKDEHDLQLWDSVTLHTKNLAGAHVVSSVLLALKKLELPKQNYRSRLWSKVDMPLWEEAEFHTLFPLDEYGDENNKINWKVAENIWSKTIITNDEGTYAVSAPTDEGYYVLEASTKDLDGNEVTEKKYIRFYSAKKYTALNSESLRFQTDKPSYEPGETAQLQLCSAYPNVSLLCSSSYQQSKLQWRALSLNTILHYTITENERGGFFTHVLFVKDNRCYSGMVGFNVPYTNKELTISTETFRDKMLPGEDQRWTLHIGGSKKEQVSAEVLATLYDASLDAFKPHRWNSMNLFQNNYSTFQFETGSNFTTANAQAIYSFETKLKEIPNKQYNILNWWELVYQYELEHHLLYAANVKPNVKFTPPVIKKAEEVRSDEIPPMANTIGGKDQPTKSKRALVDKSGSGGDGSDSVSNVTNTLSNTIGLRSNFNETAFFFPDLHTDENGNILLQFKAPESFTRWKMMAYAHGHELQEGMFSKTSVTQKEVMIVPNTPRFLREGDQMLYSAKVSNLTQQALHGRAILQVVDALTEQSVDDLFKNTIAEVELHLAAGSSEPVQWLIHIPEGFNHPVLVKTMFKTDQFSDGEQNTLPVLLNRMLVTETLPLQVKANEQKHYPFSKLLESTSSKTIRHHALSIEYTSNPAWYAIQALPYLTDYPHECAEQTFNRYYANALSSYIANSNPKINEVFASWSDKDSNTLLSNLQKNQSLKLALLEETPWVLEAKNETDQKKNLKVLFDVHRMSKELERTTRELALMQTPNGGFAWFKGMQDDRFVTQYIVTGIGRLKHLGIKEIGSETRIKEILAKAIPYLDARLAEDYQELIKNKRNMKEQHIDYYQIQWLYMRSFFLSEYPISNQTLPAFKYYKEQSATYWTKLNRAMQAMVAIALQRLGDKTTAQSIVKALRENAMHSDVLGMYWKEINSSYWWYEAPVESMSVLLECFREVAMSESEVDAIKLWLLKNKQTNNWHTTKATADACYALLLNGSYWPASQPEVSISLGGKPLLFTHNAEAGTGYVKEEIEGKQVEAAMGSIDVHVNGGKGITWGAVYWQYFEQLDNITSSETPLQLKKTMYKVKQSAKGEIMETITETSPLQVGDQVRVKIELRVNHVMEYVHLKDMRAACFEPKDVLSSYHYQNGLGYYQATKDVATHFFFSWLPTGTYVFEYPLVVTHQGQFSNGIAQAQCMYAPEFSAHSEGIRVNVKK